MTNQTTSSLSRSIDITNLDKLAAVHPLILDHLKFLIPAKLLRINKTYFDKLVRRLYETVSINRHNTNAFLYGLTSPEEVIGSIDLSRSATTFKAKALQHVKNLHLADQTAVRNLCQICPTGIFSAVQHVHFGIGYGLQIAMEARVGTLKAERLWNKWSLDEVEDKSPSILAPTFITFDMPCRESELDDEAEDLLYWWSVRLPERIYKSFKRPGIKLHITVNMQAPDPHVWSINMHKSIDCHDQLVYVVKHLPCDDQAHSLYERLALTIWDAYCFSHYPNVRSRKIVPTYQVRYPDRLLATVREVRVSGIPYETTEEDVLAIEKRIKEDLNQVSCPCAQVSGEYEEICES